MALGKGCLKKVSNSAERSSLAESISGLLQVSIQHAIFMRDVDSNSARNTKAINGGEASLSKDSSLSSNDSIKNRASVLRHKSLYYDCHSCPDFHRDKLQQESTKTEPCLRRSG